MHWNDAGLQRVWQGLFCTRACGAKHLPACMQAPVSAVVRVSYTARRHSKRYIEVLYEDELNNWLGNSLEHDRKYRRLQVSGHIAYTRASAWMYLARTAVHLQSIQPVVVPTAACRRAAAACNRIPLWQHAPGWARLCRSVCFPGKRADCSSCPSSIAT